MLFENAETSALETRQIKAIMGNCATEDVYVFSSKKDVCAETCSKCKKTVAVPCDIVKGVIKTDRARRTFVKRTGLCPVCGGAVSHIYFERI